MTPKEYLFRFVAARQPQRQTRFPHWERVRRVLLLYEAAQNALPEAIAQCRCRLEQEGKQVYTLGIRPQKETTDLGAQDSLLGKRDFSLWGYPKQAIREGLQQQPFDLLIDLTQQPTLSSRYVVLYTAAAFKVGRTDPQPANAPTEADAQPHPLYDLLIQTEPQADPTFLFDQSVRYLKLIRSND